MNTDQNRKLKRIARLAKQNANKEAATLEHLSDIEEAVDDAKASIEEVFSEVAVIREEIKKKFDSEFVFDIDPEEIRGKPGKDADEAAVEARVIEAVSPKIPTPESVAKLVKVPSAAEVARLVPTPTAEEVAALVPVPPVPTAADVAALIPKPKDGSPDSPDDIAEKLNTLRAALDFSVLKNVPEFPKPGYAVRSFVQMLDVPQSFAGQSGKSLRVNADSTALEFYTPSSGGGTWGSITGTLSAQTDLQSALDDLVPYTGATADVNIGTHRIIAHAHRADATDGARIEASDGTLVGLFGPANTANVSWYGSHIFSTMTPGSVPFFGASGLLSQDNHNFYWHDGTKQLDVYGSLGAEKVTNGTFTGSASGWTVGSGWAYSANAVSKTSNGTAVLSQSGVFVNGEEYVVSVTVSNLTVGTVTVTTSTTQQGAISANGTYTYRVVAGGNSAISFTPSNTARLTIDNVSAKLLSGGSIRTGQLNPFASHSNSTPGTTWMERFDNSGANTWTEYRFSGALRAATGANSSGGYDVYFSGGNGAAWYSGNSGLTSNNLAAYLTASVFAHYGYGGFNGGVHAGSQSTPHTKLQSNSGFAAATAWKFANFTEDGTAHTYFCDASDAACSGTPSAACSSYTNEADCLARDAHGGCSWFSGYSCSSFNGDQSSCEGQSGCTYEMASCSGVGAWDQTSCEAYSGCSWTNSPQDCSGFDEMSCGSYSGCYANYDDCTNYSDESSCTGANAACSWDGSACSGGSFFSSCSGTYDSYSCDGSYYTGSCTGTYGAACTGTAACAGIDDSTSCGAETGCTWQTAITVTMPSAASYLGRIVNFYNASSSGADVIIAPTGSDTINLTTSYTLSAYKDRATFQAAADVRSCSGLSEGACAGQAGCSVDTFNCSWDSGSGTCSGHASCTGIGDQGTCEGTTFYGGCSGSYTARKGWFLIGA